MGRRRTRRHGRGTEQKRKAEHAKAALFVCLFQGKSVALQHKAPRLHPITVRRRTLKGKQRDMKIQIINGPNLNLLGTREPGIYGSSTFDDCFRRLQQDFPGIELEYYQSNIEGELINRMQQVGFSCDGIVLNAGAYTHTSIALQDCIRSISCPVVEVHISNVHKREEFRHKSMISCACLGVICGFGMDSYRLAVEALALKAKQEEKKI